MAEEQKRVSRKFLTWLETEAASWRAGGLISEDQAAQILGRYRAVRESDERAGKLITVLAVLGSVLLGVGLILFFAANWPVIPKWLKVTVVFVFILAAYTAGYLLSFEKKTYPKVGRALIFLGALFYGAGIWLIAQIFHINAHYPNGILFWAVGILPVAMAAGSAPVLITASLLLTLWTVFEQAQFSSLNLLYLPLALAVLALSFRQKSRLAAGFTLTSLTIWAAIASTLSFGQAVPGMLLLTAAMGMLYFTLGRLQAVHFGLFLMKTPFRLVGLLIYFLSLYLLTFAGLVRNLYYGSPNPWDSVFFIASFGIAATCGVVSAILILTAGKKDSRQQNTFTLEAVLVFTAVAALILLAVFGLPAGRNTFLLATNLLLFLSIVAVVAIGYTGREANLVNLGIVFFVLDVIARYFDFFWDMLNKSVFFMGGGVLLLAGGFLLERNRKKILREMSVRQNEA